MNSKVYKCCVVPQCTNTSIKTPSKLFIYVPHKKNVRDKWLRLARRDPRAIKIKSSIYMCEDHFNLPQCMENYMEYHLMGSVSIVRMKPGCVPTQFNCQPDRKSRTSNTIERPFIIKKRRMMAIQECDKDLAESSLISQNSEPNHIPTESADSQSNEECQQEVNKMADKSIQVHIVHKFRSKAIQTKVNSLNQSTSPMKTCYFNSVSTSPFKVKTCVNTKPTKRNFNKASRKIFTVEEQSDSDISYTPSATRVGCSPSTHSLLIKSTSNCSELDEEDKKQDRSIMLQYSIKKIMKNPRSYIGIPSSCYFLLDLIQEHTNIPISHILLCLKKIRLNNSFRELADDFSINPTYSSKIFLKHIPLIASIMRPFIVKLDKEMIKKNLPMAFRHKYNHVSCIIDCLEIEVQKPSKAVNQALTWSDYKKANTMKYLVSCTPNGLVNYISPGFGGRTTDTCLVESCDFVKCLEPGMCVMADRGFKHVEQYLRQEGVLLARPPSVIAGGKLTNTEVRETKQIASLRIHVERVIRRLREFNMLKPHACLNARLIKVLDDVITIACGLINLQNSLIK